MQESDDLVSQNAPVVNSSAENTAATDDILCGSETRTILKEDGLKDIMITVPVLQRLPTTPGKLFFVWYKTCHTFREKGFKRVACFP